MNTISLTMVGIVVVLLGQLVKAFNLPISDQDIQTTVSTLVTLIGACVAFWGRYRHGDIVSGVLKK